MQRLRTKLDSQEAGRPSMAGNDLRPIIVVRRKKIVAGGHGGSWKIAYADFVTAMMAFFMLMWMLGTLDVATLNGIANYFKTPLKIALSGSGNLGDSKIILQGGGKDITAKGGQVMDKKAVQDIVKPLSMKSAKEALEREELKKMQTVKSQLDSLIESNPKLSPYKKQLMIDITTEGLRVQILDENNKPMFALSSAELEPRAKDILKTLAPALNGLPNKVSVSGHTDAKPYPLTSRTYSNWELSSDRAHAARRALVEGGMDESRMIRVIGLSSSVLLNPQDPLDPINRRISIIVLNNRAEEAALSEGRRQTVVLPVPGESEDSAENKDNKENKETKEVKDVKENKDSVEVKENK